MTRIGAQRFDVGVIGAGPAGLCAAVLTALGGARVALVGPADANAGDTRTSALFAASMGVLARTGVWPALEPAAAPLAAIRIVDRVSRDDHPSTVMFEAAEIGAAAFGHNIANRDLVRALEARFAALPGSLRVAHKVSAIEHRRHEVRLDCADGARLRVRLVAAADGRDSPAREAAGIAATGWDYGQAAIATRVAHELAHDNISTELHRPGGPLTAVPLPGRNCAIVWLERSAAADALARLDDAGLARRIGAELGSFLGAIEVAGPRGLFPVRGLSAATLAHRRTVLIGEAGHVLPPIGAQGLNLAMRDAAWLADIVGRALAAGEDPGAEPVLARYRRARRGDTMSRRTACDLLNRSLLFDGAALRGLRGIGLAGLAGVGALRRQVMRAGMGGAHSVPAEPLR
jgi:2-octaprenyl-6-methoxyphenol hydroxylase